MIKVYESVSNLDNFITNAIREYNLSDSDAEFVYNKINLVLYTLVMYEKVADSKNDIDLDYLVNDCMGGIENILLLKDEPIQFVTYDGNSHYYVNGKEISKSDKDKFYRDNKYADYKSWINKYVRRYGV